MDVFSTQIRAFLAIADAGSISEAAADLEMAKSSISYHLRRLEEALGVVLIHRTTRRLSFTPTGNRFLDSIRDMQAIAENAGRLLQTDNQSPFGPIVITAPHAMVSSVIAPALMGLTKRFPDLRPTLLAEDKRLDLLDAGVDLAITVGRLPDSDYRAQRIGTLTDVFCAAPEILTDFGLGNQLPEGPTKISLPYIAHARRSGRLIHRLTHEKTGIEALVQFNPAVTVNTVDAVAAFARQGLGVALLPEYVIATDLEQKSLIPVFPEYCLEPKPIYAVHPYGRMPPNGVRALIDELKAAV